jgi:hypothetical protein
MVQHRSEVELSSPSKLLATKYFTTKSTVNKIPQFKKKCEKPNSLAQ